MLSDDVMSGGLWCEECGCDTNHRTQQHLDAIKPDEEPLDDPLYQDDGGEC